MEFNSFCIKSLLWCLLWLNYKNIYGYFTTFRKLNNFNILLTVEQNKDIKLH